MLSVSSSGSRKWLSAWWPALAYMALIFILSAQHGLPSPPWIFALDKVQHALTYSVLGILVFRALASQTSIKASAYFWAGVISTLYGVSDEVHQHFVPDRFADSGDVIADMAGVAFGLILLFLFHKHREYRTKGVT